MELRPHERKRHRHRHLPTTRQTHTAASRHNRSNTTGNPHADRHTAHTTTGTSLITLHRDPMPGDAAGITSHLPDRHGRIVHQTATKADRTTFFFDEVLRKLPAADENPVSTTDIAAYYQLDNQRTRLLSNGMQRLARHGLAEKAAKQKGIRYRHWRRTPLGDEHVTNKDTPADKHPVILTAPAGASGTQGAQT
ncbi:hypothetical protein [Salinispora arenicola]|uniref:hypothetical protein n=1 Tax=Salinispora arenicola TaxID=168697 RepID=UPI0003805AC9|nr:hypothetical protein [Salinispora arenicola]